MKTIALRQAAPALAALVLAFFVNTGPVFACEEECVDDPVNPECPTEKINCEPYTETYQHGDGNWLYNCVDTYQPVNDQVDEGEECEYTLASHDCDFCRRWKGCFDPSTKITMADKSVKMAVQIKEGDLLWNPLTDAPVAVTKRVAGPEELPLIEIGYGAVRVKVTQDHPMIVFRTELPASMSSAQSSDTFMVKQAADLTTDDAVLGADGSYHRVEVLRQLPLRTHQTVVNFELAAPSAAARDHAVVANGVVTGDLAVQVNAAKEKAF